MEGTFEHYIETNDLHCKYAKGEPSLEGQEFHDYNEFVLFLGGKAHFISKNIQQELSVGSIVIIPKEHFHQFCITDQQSYTRCVLGFRETQEMSELIEKVFDSIKVISIPEERVARVFENLTDIMKSGLEKDEKALFIKSSLIQLLVYLKQNISEVIRKSVKLSPIVSRALNIIDEKYNENLTVEGIAGILFVSTSTLSHKFRKELGISVYQYITKKRLMEAHKLINCGETLSHSAERSGFSDYSCFYRLYKKYYGR